MLMHFVLVAAALLAFTDAKKELYAFTGDGVDIIDPVALKISTHLPHNLTVAGTKKRMCTKNKRSRTRCSWAGVANAGDRYIYAADSSGNRVIVFDVEQRQPIKAIKTHGFPYQVTYLAALDEVWILCWRNNLLDVIGDKSDGSTLIHHVRNASSLAVLHSIQAQTVKSYKYIAHSYFRAENCQNQNQSVKYGVVSHYNEPGIHKIDLLNKRYDKFINTSSYNCKATFGLAYSSVKNYAFVQCLGEVVGNKQSKMVVVDVENDVVVHSDDAMTEKATGYPYSSPDGKFVLVLNPDRVIIYYLGNAKKNMKRLSDVVLDNFLPSQVAFVKRKNGYWTYMTSKNTDTMLVISLLTKPRRKVSVLKNVGFATDLSAQRLKNAEKRYLKYYKNLLKKTGKNFVQEEFEKYVKNMVIQHVTRRISVGCGSNDRLVASPAYVDNKMAIINGFKIVGMVEGVAKVKSLLWVGQH